MNTVQFIYLMFLIGW